MTLITAQAIKFSPRYAAPLNVRASSAQLTLVLGADGRGKRVLMQTLAGLRAPLTGQISVLGEDLLNVPAKTWQNFRQHIGYISPSCALVSHLTVLQNVGLPLIYHRLQTPDNADHQAQQLLYELDLVELADRLPGYLNQAQRRRVALARCLISNPAILFVENAFSYMDLDSQKEFVALYASLLNSRRLCLVLADNDLRPAAKLAHAVQTPVPCYFFGRNQIDFFDRFDTMMLSTRNEITTFIQDHEF